MEKARNKGISSFTLHISAMLLMLCDHLWSTLFPYEEWLTCIGRIAFPIFAFMISEGYFHTSDINKYVKRLFVFACISEIPFNLVVGSSAIYPLHQNVLWTFLIALLCIRIIEKAKKSKKLWLIILTVILTVFFGSVLGIITMADYHAVGVLTVLVFYFFHEKKWWCFLAQFICLAYLNIEIIGGYCYTFTVFGYEIQIVQQGFALLALIPIWLYNGRQGYHAKWFQYACYAFYPLHLLIIYLIWQCVI